MRTPSYNLPFGLWLLTLSFLLIHCTTLEDDSVPGDEDWTFVVIGDVQQGYGVYGHLAEKIAVLQPTPSAAFQCGDIMLRPANEVEWLTFRRYSSPITDQMPLLIARGNHEGNDPASETVFRENTTITGDHFYSTYTFQQCCFIILDTEVRGEESSVAGEQLSWLRDELAAADADPAIRHVFMIMHRPLFPQGFHSGSMLENADELHALFQGQVKLRAVFSGHDHLFNRYILDGMNYITTGAGGAPLHRGYGGDYHHFTKVSVYEDEDRIHIRTIGLFGEVVEDFDL